MALQSSEKWNLRMLSLAGMSHMEYEVRFVLAASEQSAVNLNIEKTPFKLIDYLLK